MKCSVVRLLLVAVVAGYAVAAPAARADTIVSSVPVWNGTDNTGFNFGTPSTVTMGETFTNTPNFGALTGFTFNIKNNTANPFQITTSVYAWTGTTTSGSALFTSSPITVVGNGISPGYQSITTSTGSISLIAGGKYLALASISSVTPGINSSWAQASGAGSSFFGGQYVSTNTAIAPGSAWTVSTQVSAFTMSFAPAAASVPEPSTMLLGAVASALTVGGRFLRRRKAS